MQLGHDDAVLITGGGSGLGAATARRLAPSGAKLVLVDLPGSAGMAVADELGERAVFVPADVREPDEVQAAIEVAVAGAAQQETRLRAVVCCAGVATPGRILGKRGVLDLEVFRHVVEVNLIGSFNVLRLGAAAMAENNLADGDRGVVVLTSSVAAYDGQIGQAAYAASKGGIVSLTLTAARDLAQAGIRVMTIAPGVMETPMLAGLPEEARTSLEALVPHPSRLGKPEEYAQLVEHILANSLLNGEVIRLDGALRMPPR